ncbi:type II secretion system minor pseudopilin GspK [Photobacterium swingsii]|uniref:Type II secretion system protein K n=1 Tax=Photobacterium swingsii TaxID=680026 RepID=A0A0J8XVP6_9GAMM|nr:type II secretion system minor pseudopilin GspK [Photobacterium swingsii]KMV29439.1 general secretion pathway protein GspK [Photobacterium swingsii]PSW20444.1 general secretion pathway protein GspK [Photobacterium swingsii]
MIPRVKLAKKPAKKQQGVALIVVLMLLAMMTLLAVQMTDRLQHNFYRVESQIQHQQAYWYSMGLEALAKVAIKEGIDDSDTVNLSQAWATKGQRYPLEGGDAVGDILDRQACFNLNALSAVAPEPDRSTKPYLIKVLQALLEESGIESYEAEVMTESAWEFVDPDDTVQSAFGAEDSTYEGFKPAYLPANHLMADMSELRAVNGVTATAFNQVKRAVCALPVDTFKLNVNTVSENNAALLAALFTPELSVSDAKTLLTNRPYDGWQNVDEFFAENVIARIDGAIQSKAKEHIDIKSDYFQLDAEILVDRARVRVVALLKRDEQKQVTVVRRRYGGISERVADNQAK